MQNNLFSSLFLFALFSLIQSEVKIFRWRQESGMGLVFRREDLPLQCHLNPASQLYCPPVRTSSLLVHRVDLWMPPGEVWDGPRRRTGSLLLYPTRSMPLNIMSPLSNTVALLLPTSNSCCSSICACPTPVDPASPAHLPPCSREHSLQKQGGAVESDSEPMVSDMIQHQLTDLCFREIGSRVAIGFLRNPCFTVTNKTLEVQV